MPTYRLSGDSGGSLADTGLLETDGTTCTKKGRKP